jgi:DUF2924 family protein
MSQTIPAKIAALSVTQLHDKLEQLTGARPTSRNKPYLQRLVVKKLAEQAPARRVRAHRPSAAETAEICDAVNTGRARRTTAPGGSPKAVDPRLPAVGTVLTREHGGRTHNVTVLADGLFRYGRATYKSLSTIAREITGTIWNGYLFFRLEKYPARNKHQG